MGEKEKTEQAAKPSEKTEQAERPSDLHSAMELFREEQAKTAKEKPSSPDEEAQDDKTEDKQTESPDQEDVEETGTEPKGEAEEEEDDKGGEEPSPPAFKLVDEKGEMQPFVIKVDGKDVTIDSYDKLKTYAQLGYHGNQRLEEINRKEKTLEQAAHMMEQIMAAAEDGRLVIKPPGSSKTGQSGAEQTQGEETEVISSEELELMDEDIRKPFEKMNKRMQKLEQENKGLKSENDNLKKLQLGEVLTKAKSEMDSAIGEVVEQYPYAKGKDKRIYQLLAEKNESDEPRYSIDEAVKMVHEEVDQDIRQHVKNHPEYKKATEEQKKAWITEYLKQKDDNESAPVNPPSVQPAGGTSTKKEKPKFNTMSEALQAFNRDVLKPQREAGTKH